MNIIAIAVLTGRLNYLGTKGDNIMDLFKVVRFKTQHQKDQEQIAQLQQRVVQLQMQMQTYRSATAESLEAYRQSFLVERDFLANMNMEWREKIIAAEKACLELHYRVQALEEPDVTMVHSIEEKIG